MRRCEAGLKRNGGLFLQPDLFLYPLYMTATEPLHFTADLEVPLDLRIIDLGL